MKKIGTLFGGDLRLHWSALVFPAGVLIYCLFVVPWREAIFYLALNCGVYLCVLTHEIGQLLAARWFRLGPRSVTLYPFWGAVRYARLSERPWAEVYVAVSGILVQGIILSAIGGVVVAANGSLDFDLQIESPYYAPFGSYLFWSNAMLLAFYAVPVLPLDGGKLFRALLTLQSNRLRATEIVTGMSTFAALVLLVAGIVWFRNPLPALIAAMLYMSAQDDLGITRFFASLRHDPDDLDAPRPLHVPVDQVLPIAEQPNEENFTGYIWNARSRLWIEWRNGHPVAANALLGE